jgi:amphi-Trp domain-containing protein
MRSATAPLLSSLKPKDSMSSEKVTYDAQRSRLDCVEMLQKLAAAVESGAVCISSSDQTLRLVPNTHMKLHFEGKRSKNGAERLELRLDWTQPRSGRLSIGTGARAEAPASTGAPDPTVAMLAGELWIRQERLAEMAADMQLEAGSEMTRGELCQALVDAGVDPLSRLSHDEVLAIAEGEAIEDRSALSFDELVLALKTRLRARVAVK